MASLHQQILSAIQPFVDRLSRMERQYNELQLECQSLKDQLRNANPTGTQKVGQRGMTESSRKRVVTLMSPSNRTVIKEDPTNIASTKTSRFPGTKTEFLKKSVNPRPLTAMSPNYSKMATKLPKSPMPNLLPGKVAISAGTNSKNTKGNANVKHVDVKIIKGNAENKEPIIQVSSVIPIIQVRNPTQMEDVPPHSNILKSTSPFSKVLGKLELTEVFISSNSQDLEVNLDDTFRAQPEKSENKQLVLNTPNPSVHSKSQTPSQIAQLLVQQVKLQKIPSAQSLEETSEKQITGQGKLSILISNDSRPFASFVENEPSTTQLDQGEESDQLI